MTIATGLGIAILLIGAFAAVVRLARPCRHPSLRALDSGIAECRECGEIVPWNEVYFQ